jgi:hypothetical protein
MEMFGVRMRTGLGLTMAPQKISPNQENPRGAVAKIVTSKSNAAGHLILLIRHPNVELSFMSEELGLKPYRQWQLGEKRTAPGKSGPKGAWPDFGWMARWKVPSSSAFRALFDEVLDKVEDSSNAFLEIKSTGGCCSLFFRFPKVWHVGVSVSNHDMKRIAHSALDFGFEIWGAALPEGGTTGIKHLG